jgi:hypothetical protein
MDIYQYATLTQITIFILYITLIVYKYGILESISASWYSLPKKWQPLFWLFATSIGFCMLPYTDYHSLFFLSGGGLVFVGTAAGFEDEKMTNRVHYTGAVLGIGAAILGLYLFLNTLTPLYITLLFLITSIIFHRTHIIWWTEIGAFVGIVYGLIQLNF